jgi:hypothetical protein
MNFIERLQNKPYYIRVQILWIAVILIMAIIILIWSSILNFSLVTSGNKQSSSEKHSLPSLFTTIKEDFSLLKKSLQAGVEDMVGGEEKEGIEVEILKPLKLPEP